MVTFSLTLSSNFEDKIDILYGRRIRAYNRSKKSVIDERTLKDALL